jgi:solute carrier family 25 (mitochondrial S-adenosylmethionine transporter), member 26
MHLTLTNASTVNVLQLQDSKGVKYVGAIEAVSRIVRDEGAAKLFTGIGPRVMWISIG